MSAGAYRLHAVSVATYYQDVVGVKNKVKGSNCPYVGAAYRKSTVVYLKVVLQTGTTTVGCNPRKLKLCVNLVAWKLIGLKLEEPLLLKSNCSR